MLALLVIIIIMAYTQQHFHIVAAGISDISASDIGQASNTGEIPLLFSRSVVD